MYEVAIIPMPTAAELQAILNERADEARELLFLSVDPASGRLILIFAADEIDAP